MVAGSRPHAGLRSCRPPSERVASACHGAEGGPIARTILRLGVSVAVLAVLFHRVGLDDVLEICLAARPELLALAVLLYASGQVLSALRWRALASGVGFRIPTLEYVRIYFIGMFFG